MIAIHDILSIDRGGDKFELFLVNIWTLRTDLCLGECSRDLVTHRVEDGEHKVDIEEIF